LTLNNSALLLQLSDYARYFRLCTPGRHIIMPSIFKKFNGTSKNNPYVNPNHPSHAPIQYISPSGRSQSQPTPAPRSASPRGSIDHLAEARISAGRDPVTGRAIQRPNLTAQTASETDLRSRVRTNGAVERSGPSDERTAFASRAAMTKQTTGNKYDLFMQMMAEKKNKEEMAHGNVGKTEYYAPKRRVSEFYAGGVGR
jgi:hypothetical protein